MRIFEINLDDFDARMIDEKFVVCVVWCMAEKVDQIFFQYVGRIFIKHGGGNTLHEYETSCAPIVVILCEVDSDTMGAILDGMLVMDKFVLIDVIIEGFE